MVKLLITKHLCSQYCTSKSMRCKRYDRLQTLTSWQAGEWRQSSFLGVGHSHCSPFLLVSALSTIIVTLRQTIIIHTEANYLDCDYKYLYWIENYLRVFTTPKPQKPQKPQKAVVGVKWKPMLLGVTPIAWHLI